MRYKINRKDYCKSNGGIKFMNKNDSKCSKKSTYEESDLLAFALLALLVLFAFKYIIYPDIVVYL